MSYAATRASKKFHRICCGCRGRKARFRYRNDVRADRDHVLCFECHRSLVNRQRALRLIAIKSNPRVGADLTRSPLADARPTSTIEYHRCVPAHVAAVAEEALAMDGGQLSIIKLLRNAAVSGVSRRLVPQAGKY